MIRALGLAVTDTLDPRLRGVLFRTIGLAALVLAGLWGASTALIAHTTFFETGWLQVVTQVLGSVASLAIAWILFPSVFMLVMGFFLDGVVSAIEARRYPGLPPPRAQSVPAMTAAALRLGGLALLLNLLALPVYIVLLITGISLPLFLVLNGYLLGREYFELVALRRMDDVSARRFRRRHGAAVFGAGVAIAFLLTIPFVNLAAPLVGAALMLHLFENWRLAY
jgi:CysZ protein